MKADNGQARKSLGELTSAHSQAFQDPDLMVQKQNQPVSAGKLTKNQANNNSKKQRTGVLVLNILKLGFHLIGNKK